MRLESISKAATFYVTMAFNPETVSRSEGFVWYRGGSVVWFVMKYRPRKMDPNMDDSGYREMPFGVNPEQWDLRQAGELVYIIDMLSCTKGMS